MSYGSPAIGGYPAPFGQPPARPEGRALPGLAVLMIVQVVLQLSILIWQVNRVGAEYFKFAFGFGTLNQVPGCGMFSTNDTMQCVALIVMIIAAFMGRAWVRPAVTVLLLINAYVLGASLINALASSDGGWSAMTTPTTPFLWLTLDLIAQTVISLLIPIIVLATRNPGLPRGYQPLAAMPAPVAPVPQPGYGPPMAQPLPPQDIARGGTPGFPPPPMQPPGQPGQPPMQPPGQPPYGGYNPNR
jgi:hypothetical protein